MISKDDVYNFVSRFITEVTVFFIFSLGMIEIYNKGHTTLGVKNFILMASLLGYIGFREMFISATNGFVWLLRKLKKQIDIESEEKKLNE